jgi:pimeloyl-ACP methyl ester carboxylesterase
MVVPVSERYESVTIDRDASQHLALPMLKLLLLLLAPGCTSPETRGFAFAQQHHFERNVVQGGAFRHVVWHTGGSAVRVLHVYLDGDGSPHPTPHTVASDPTPREPLMLHLMALDRFPSVYVGRPCYWGLQEEPGCTSFVWTIGRFSASVVDSVAEVIRHEQVRAGAQRTVLYAHSGGAAIALLVAQRGLHVSSIVTVGGNLDPDAWTTLHGYSPLAESLNPVKERWTEPAPPMIHYVGTRDEVVPATLVHAAAALIGGEVHEIPGFDHQCCWERLWPTVLGAQ